jgi:rsbT co-antagonist protein RsbR
MRVILYAQATGICVVVVIPMQQLFQKLLTVNVLDDNVRRRSVMLLILAYLLQVMAIASVPLVFLRGNVLGGLLAIIMGMVLAGVTIALAHRGRATAGGLLLMTAFAGPTLASLLNSGQGLSPAYFLVLALLVGSLVLRPHQIWLVLGVLVAALWLVVNAAPGNLLSNVAERTTVINVSSLLVMVATFGFVGAWTTQRVTLEGRRAREEAELAARQLSEMNSALDQRVNERTIALQSALEEVKARAAEQARLLSENEQQRVMIRDLSVPVMPISKSTLVMPLVGALDAQRLEDLQQQALHAIEQTSARQLLLDITGVPVVDTQVAQGIVGVVQAARLLGAEVVLIGIRPEVAQAVVGLGIDLSSMRSYADLQTALSTPGAGRRN